MRIKLLAFWERLAGSFWFLPALIVVMAMVLAVVMIEIDHTSPPLSSPLLSWVFTGSPDGARALLSAIATSMISVAGVTFSITLATLSLASSQLGPRLLNNFMRDRVNQAVLGTFVAVFIYCLLVLREIRSLAEISFVPHFSVTLAIMLTIISLGMLIYFFHHVSTMIQAQTLVANIGRELEQSIRRLFSRETGRGRYEYRLREDGGIPDDYEDNITYVAASASGYLQYVDSKALERTATEEDLLLRLLYRPGGFITKGSEIVAVYPADGLSEDAEKKIQDALTVGTQRLRMQDIEFAIDQLVEIAVRALSPGINDPFTVIACLDQFSNALSELAEQTIPTGYYYDDRGRLRVISDAVTFKGIVDSAFNQIRQHGRSDVAVTIRMLEVIAIILARTKTDAQRRALIRQAEMIKHGSDEVILEAQDREDIAARYELIMRVLDDGQPAVDVDSDE